MLYKNDVIYELSRFPKDFEEVENFSHKFPVKSMFSPGRIVPVGYRINAYQTNPIPSLLI